MKEETYLNKLNELLGIKEKVEELPKFTKAKPNDIVAVDEDEIDDFREKQAVLYYLRAPALFTSKTCSHCGDTFLVSRKYVGYCSYTCTRKALEELGIKWSKGEDLEALANDPQVWNGNEPLWIRQSTLESLEKSLTSLRDTLSSHQQTVPQTDSTSTTTSESS